MGEETLHELGASNIHLGRKQEKRKNLPLMELVNICCSVPGRAPREISGGRGGVAKKMKENLLFSCFPPWKDTKQTNRRIRMRPCVAAEAGSWGGGLCGWEGAVEGKQRAGYEMGTSCLLKEMIAGLFPELWGDGVPGWLLEPRDPGLGLCN